MYPRKREVQGVGIIYGARAWGGGWTLRSSSERETSPIGSVSSTLSTSTVSEAPTRPSQTQWPRSVSPSCGTGPRSSAGPGVPGDSPRRTEARAVDIPPGACRVRRVGTRIPGLRGRHPAPRRRGQGALRVAGLYRACRREVLPQAPPSSGGCVSGSPRRVLHHASRERAGDEGGGPCRTVEAGRPMSNSWSARVRSPNGLVCVSTTECTRGGRATSRSPSRWRCSELRADAKRTFGTGLTSSSGHCEPGTSRRRDDRPWSPSWQRILQGALRQGLHSTLRPRDGLRHHIGGGR